MEGRKAEGGVEKVKGGTKMKEAKKEFGGPITMVWATGAGGNGGCIQNGIMCKSDHMSMDEYQRLAQRTSNTKAESGKLENGILGMCGEAGECADIVKKYFFQMHELDREKLAEELGDVLWYVAETAQGLDMTLEEVARGNLRKLEKRYPEGFDPERSINREE